MSNLIGPVLPPSPVELSPEEIERSLGELWREIEGAQSGATQVRMLNLLVYLPEQPASDIGTAISNVAVQHPGRTITLIFDDNPPRAEATIACRVGDDARQACGEQIILQGSSAGHPLHSLAISLLQPGLPVTIWWHGPVEFESHLFGEFAKVADRIVLDSRTWPDPLPALITQIKIVQTNGSLLRFSDLQWVALTPWRRLIAQVFDLPAARKALPSMREIVVDYGGPAQIGTGALLLAGWLMSRLGWEMDGIATRDETGYILPLRRISGSEQAGLMLALRRRETEDDISSLQMRATGEHSGQLTFDIMPDDLHIKTSIELSDIHPMIQTTRLRRREPSELLSEELALNTADPVYQAALAAGARLAEALRTV